MTCWTRHFGAIRFIRSSPDSSERVILGGDRPKAQNTQQSSNHQPSTCHYQPTNIHLAEISLTASQIYEKWGRCKLGLSSLHILGGGS